MRESADTCELKDLSGAWHRTESRQRIPAPIVVPAHRAQHEADCDSLTGLSTRRVFNQRTLSRLREPGSRAHGLCLLYINLDGFKLVNEGLGLAAGDAVLRVVGIRLAHAVRDADPVCRQGGDEFVCLLPGVHCEAHALAIAARLRNTISQPCELGLPTGPVRVQASVGVALFPQHGDTLQALLEGADHAMLRARARQQGTAMALHALLDLA